MRATAPAMIIALVLGIGCGGSSTPPAEAPAGGAARAGSSQADRAADLVGRWGPTLPESEAHAVTTARCALAEPPDDDAFERFRPTAEDRDNYRALIKLRTTDPDSPMLAKVRRKLAEFDAILVEITPTTIAWRTPSSETRHRYRVVSARDENVTLTVEHEETLDVRFLDRNHIEMRGSTRSFLLTRDGAEGGPGAALDARDPPRASNGAAPLPGPGPGARPATSGADACSAYADCIDQMPRLASDQSLMNVSSSTIRGWTKTPDRLKQCASALELAQSAGLCH